MENTLWDWWCDCLCVCAKASIKLKPDGEFLVFNEGKRPLYIDSRPVLSGDKGRLHHNSVFEVHVQTALKCLVIYGAHIRAFPGKTCVRVHCTSGKDFGQTRNSCFQLADQPNFWVLEKVFFIYSISQSLGWSSSQWSSLKFQTFNVRMQRSGILKLLPAKTTCIEERMRCTYGRIVCWLCRVLVGVRLCCKAVPIPNQRVVIHGWKWETQCLTK